MPQSPVPFPRAAHDGAFPEDAPLDDQLRFMLNYAVLAPSVLNTQPWRFRVANGTVFLYADPSRKLPAVDADGRELVISCGAALMNLRLAVRHYGYEVAWEGVDDPSDPDLLATLHAGDPAPPTRDEEALFQAVPRRQTERRPFAQMEVPGAVIRELELDVERDGCRLLVLTTEEEKTALARHVGEAIRRQGRDPSAIEDYTLWLRADDDPRPDGVRDERQPEFGRRAESRMPTEPFAVGMEDLAAGSPALLVLSTARDDRASWLDAGQALERALLRATAHGLSASYLNQVVEVAEIRREVTELTQGLYPQVVFRVGHPIPRGGTQRRAVREVLE